MQAYHRDGRIQNVPGIGFDLLNKLCDAWGLSENVTGIDLRIRMDEVPTLTVEQLVTQEQGEAAETVLTEYRLIEVEESQDGNDTTQKSSGAYDEPQRASAE